MRDPLVPPLIALALGIVCSRAVSFTMPEAAIPAALIALLAVIARLRSTRRVAWAAGLAAVCFAGILTGLLQRSGPPPQIDFTRDETMLLAGCVVEPVAQSPDREQFVLELAPGARVRVNWYLKEGETAPGLRYGQRIEMEARLRTPRNYGNPGAFDFAGYLARRGIYWTATANAKSALTVQGSGCGRWPLTWIYPLREAALDRLDELFATRPYPRAMTRALLLGDTALLERSWAEDYRRTGTYHALVISGLHLTLLSGWFLFFLRVVSAGVFWSLFSTSLIAWTYAAMSGSGAPVVRAAAGLTLYLLCHCFFRNPRVLNLLAAVAIGFLLADPDQLFDASFQLSFLSVAMIGAVAAPLLERSVDPYARGMRRLGNVAWDRQLPPKVAQMRVEMRLLAETLEYAVRLPQRVTLIALDAAGRLLFYCAGLLAVSAVVQAGLLLPMVAYFHRLSVSGLTANLFIVPIMNAVVLIGFSAIFTGWHWLADLAALLLDAARRIAALHAAFEPPMRIPDPPPWVAAGFLITLAVACVALRGRRHWAARTVLAAPWLVFVALVAAHPFDPERESGRMEITTLDVGQGDGLLVAAPQGGLLLVDAGGFPVFGKRPTRPPIDVGEEVISPYLFHRRIHRVDAIAVTHAHEDHIGGLRALVENFRPKELWTGAFPDTDAWRAQRAWIESRGVRIRAPKAGEAIAWSGMRIEVLSPPEDYLPAASPKNNDSLVLRLVHGRHSAMLTGDVEKAMEARMVEDGRLTRTDVLKVAHHGSKTSSTHAFLDAVQPAWAIVSNGAGNLFHHPHPEVMDRLRERGIQVWTTEHQGQVRMVTDGVHGWALESYQWPVRAAAAR